MHLKALFHATSLGRNADSPGTGTNPRALACQLPAQPQRGPPCSFWAVSMGTKIKQRLNMFSVPLSLPLCLPFSSFPSSPALLSTTPMPTPISRKPAQAPKAGTLCFRQTVHILCKRVVNLSILLYCTPYQLFPGFYPYLCTSRLIRIFKAVTTESGKVKFKSPFGIIVWTAAAQGQLNY